MSAPIQQWIPEPVSGDVHRSLRQLAREDDVVQVAVMPDVHLAHDVCVGVAVATKELLYPAAIGGDIGCGVAALRFEGPAAEVRSRAEVVLGYLRTAVPIRKQRRRPATPPWPDIGRPRHPSVDRTASREGMLEFGTIGRGNHFLELQSGADGALWAMVHTGSRAMGPAVQRAYSPLGTRRRSLVGIAAASTVGQDYLADQEWALAYARASREHILVAAGAVIMRVLGLQPDLSSYIECVHNLVRREDHGDGPIWVHRKGAISAAAREPGIIPGSMGSPTYLVEGRGCREALCSSSHGAGRCMSRSEARERITKKDLQAQMGEVCFDVRKAHQLREEAPGAYKDIRKVMRAQRELTRIIAEHWPVLNYKGA